MIKSRDGVVSTLSFFIRSSSLSVVRYKVIFINLYLQYEISLISNTKLKNQKILHFTLFLHLWQQLISLHRWSLSPTRNPENVSFLFFLFSFRCYMIMSEYQYRKIILIVFAILVVVADRPGLLLMGWLIKSIDGSSVGYW